MRRPGLGGPICTGLEHGAEHECRIMSEGAGNGPGKRISSRNL